MATRPPCARPERKVDLQLVDRMHEDAEVAAEALEERLVDLRRERLARTLAPNLRLTIENTRAARANDRVARCHCTFLAPIAETNDDNTALHGRLSSCAVSYTHLTLPTSDLV